jgi:prepilin-type processing-associated H-X9-DG protein
VGPEACRDGLSNTLVVVETANSSVTWTEPIDLSAEQMLFEIGAGDGSEVGSFHSRGANVVFGDGHVAFLPDSISPEELRGMATRDGGEAVSMDY